MCASKSKHDAVVPVSRGKTIGEKTKQKTSAGGGGTGRDVVETPQADSEGFCGVPRPVIVIIIIINPNSFPVLNTAVDCLLSLASAGREDGRRRCVSGWVSAAVVVNNEREMRDPAGGGPRVLFSKTIQTIKLGQTGDAG